jgi:hypothetical protein
MNLGLPGKRALIKRSVTVSTAHAFSNWFGGEQRYG